MSCTTPKFKVFISLCEELKDLLIMGSDKVDLGLLISIPTNNCDYWGEGIMEDKFLLTVQDCEQGFDVKSYTFDDYNLDDLGYTIFIQCFMVFDEENYLAYSSSQYEDSPFMKFNGKDIQLSLCGKYVNIKNNVT